ncbi:MAG: helix-turn-helix domain-containing protein [Acetobacteraceae bacterium]
MRRVACRRCGTVKRERLDFLADNPHFTRRFAFYVGRRCRQASVRDVAAELKLTWDTVKALEMQYMRAQIERAGTPGPRTIGIDEIAVRKGHDYRIVVSDLVRKRPIWFGGDDRSYYRERHSRTPLAPGGGVGVHELRSLPRDGHGPDRPCLCCRRQGW